MEKDKVLSIFGLCQKSNTNIPKDPELVSDRFYYYAMCNIRGIKLQKILSIILLYLFLN